MKRLKEIIIILFCFIMLFISLISIYRKGIVAIALPLIGFIILTIILFLIHKHSKTINDFIYKKPIKIIWFILIFIFTLFIGYSLRTGLEWDYGEVINSSFDYVKNGVQELKYFAMYSNNVVLLTIMNLFCKVFLLIYKNATVTSFQCFTIFINCIIITASYYLLLLISNKRFNKINTLVLLFLLTIYINFYLFAPILYSDTPALLLIMTTLLFHYLYDKEENRKKKILYFILMLLAVALAFKIKATSIFLYCAIFGIWFLNKEFKKCIISVPIIIVCILSISFITNKAYPIPEETYEQYSFPYIHWITMSLNPDVIGYSKEDEEHLLEFNGTEAKTIESKRILEERKKELGNKGVIKRIFFEKPCYVWRSENIGSAWMLDQNPPKRGIMHEFFSQSGKYRTLPRIFLRSAWLVLIFGTLLSGLINLKKKDDNILIYQMCIIAEFLFLCIWEVHSRYIYSFLPFFFLTSSYGYSNAFDLIEHPEIIKKDKTFKKYAKLYKKHEEIINYIIIGGLTTLISLIVKYGLLFTILDAKNAIQLQIAVVVSWIVAVIFAYVTNRIFVFKSKSKEILKEITKFFGSRIATLLLDAFIMWFFVTLLKLNSNLQVVIITLVSQVLVIVANYILSKIFVFKKDNKKRA